ncbi:EF-hand domain-containing protein [Roseibium sp. Sym1]|uniref:EF-hand domain-containing protein n=1 Tax=Roseibium sp. Sym1 TaxID=3016006 RepID=UPI0022B3F923|nr:EF-hand domain-containing protein [Roseibium sp. Sym1]
MKPFKKIAIAALAASVAGTALTAGLSASAQDPAANGDGGKQVEQTFGQRFAHMGERGERGWGRGHGGRRGGEHRAERLFERFDVNEDGVITEAEIAEVRAQNFASADADGNGEVSLEEFKAAFMERSNDRMVRAFQFLDSDGDGTVTREEADTAANRMFNMLDRDGNGTVERVRGPRGPQAGDDDDVRGPRGQQAGRGERGERGERGGHHGPRGPHTGRGGPGHMFLAMFDTDGDGKVSREDFDARRAELFALADTDGSGSFTLEDFGPLWLAVNESRIVDRFQRADADGSLGITADEHDKRLDELMERTDRNRDGVITKADFQGGKKGKGKGHGKGWRHHDRG